MHDNFYVVELFIGVLIWREKVVVIFCLWDIINITKSKLDLVTCSLIYFHLYLADTDYIRECGKLYIFFGKYLLCHKYAFVYTVTLCRSTTSERIRIPVSCFLHNVFSLEDVIKQNINIHNNMKTKLYSREKCIYNIWYILNEQNRQ